MASLHEQVAACEHERIGVAHACLEQPFGVEHVIYRARYARVERCDVVGVDMWSSRESVYEFTVIGLVLLVPVFLKHELVESFVLLNCEGVPSRVAALAQEPGVLDADSLRAPDTQFLNFREKITSYF